MGVKMNDAFKIYVEQLRDGHTERIAEEFPPKILEVEEKDLKFLAPIKVDGEAYLAEDDLVIHLAIETAATLSCTICNDPVEVPIRVDDFYHVEPLKNIKSGVFNFREVLRDDILLNTPHFAECSEGKCPKRSELKKYMKSDAEGKKQADEEGYQPFADLTIDHLKPKKKKKK